MVLEKIENTDYNQVKSDLIRFMSWDKKHLDSFFDTYKDTIFSMIKKYNNALENREKNTKFRL